MRPTNTTTQDFLMTIYMKAKNISILCLMLLFTAPIASGQSLMGRLKNLGKAVKETVKQMPNKAADTVTEQVTNQVLQKGLGKTSKQQKSSSSDSRNAQLEEQYRSMTGLNDGSMEDETPTVRLPKEHTALFAPLGYPVEAELGVKTVKPSMPPTEASKQVAWVEKRPSIDCLDNQSLVDEYLLLKECLEGGTIAYLSPAGSRLGNVEDEVGGRANELNELVKQYNEAISNYQYSEIHNWVLNGIHDRIASVLSGRLYKTLIKSSIAPLFTLKENFINEDTKAYFAKHGGYQNATKQNLTSWDPRPDKQEVSVGGQQAVITDENEAGATVDIGGVVYVLHTSSRGQGYAFLTKVEGTAVAGKDVVIPDYIPYKGKKYPVTKMRGAVFAETKIKSIKLPATLKEIPNATFRGTAITEIVIPASVTKLQGSVFQNCTKLAKVVFEGESIHELSGSFQNCVSLKSVKFPRNLTGFMSYDMFSGCTLLSEVVLPENLTTLPSSTFNGCKNLKSVTIPSSVKKIGDQAFAGSGIVSVDISSATEIDALCFMNCKSLKSVKLNASLKENFLTETYDAFMGCPLLEVKWANNQYVYPEGGFIFVP